ncbi:MAG: PEP/pyruvate-binding domain-containing protein, partial [Elusimicrobia bacterium]|nr:PEP/pyruvate-binding domain-containing protein [Elusimicrobiota bacterium]
VDNKKVEMTQEIVDELYLQLQRIKNRVLSLSESDSITKEGIERLILIVAIEEFILLSHIKDTEFGKKYKTQIESKQKLFDMYDKKLNRFSDISLKSSYFELGDRGDWYGPTFQFFPRTGRMIFLLPDRYEDINEKEELYSLEYLKMFVDNDSGTNKEYYKNVKQFIDDLLYSSVQKRFFSDEIAMSEEEIKGMSEEIAKVIAEMNAEAEAELESKIEAETEARAELDKARQAQTKVENIAKELAELQTRAQETEEEFVEIEINLEEEKDSTKTKKVTIKSVSSERISFEEEIKKQLDKFITSSGKYSVRSSGVGEDATNNAFAGMGETSLNVKYGDVYDNVRKCWKSFFAERCIDYMISSGQVVKPAVLVEEMIDSEISGVAFTRNKYGNATINVLFGQGEGLVSGMFTPDSILVDMNSGEVIEYSVANKQFKLVTDIDGGIKKVPVGSKAKTRALNSKMVKKLTENLSILENAVGYPIDVEFSIVGDEIYILQMRPITTLDNKEKLPEKGTDTKKDSDIVNMDEIPFAEPKYEISLSVGNIKGKKDVFVYIQDPSNPTKSIPIYRTSVNGQFTEFIVDSKYAPLVKNGVLSKLLLYRVNNDPVVLAKLNDGLFNFKSGEIALMPVLDEDILEKSLLENTIEDEMNNVRRMLASA